MPRLEDLAQNLEYLRRNGSSIDSLSAQELAGALATDMAGEDAFTGAFVPAVVADAPTGVAATDTAALQAAVTAAQTAGGVVRLRAGTYVINDPIVVAPTQYSGIAIIGAGRPSRNLVGRFSYIRQDGGNEPVIKFTQAETTNCYFADFGVGYTNPSGTGNTAQVGFLFDGDTAGNGAGWFDLTFERIAVLNAYDGWKLDTAAGESASVWGTTWTDILLADIQHHCWDLICAVPIGQPINSFRDIYINNASGSVVSTGHVFEFSAVEATMSGLDIEGWTNRIYSGGGGFSVDMRGVHIEHHEIDASTSEWTLFYQGAGALSIRNMSVSGTSAGGSPDITAIANADTGGIVTLEDITLYWSSISAGTNHLVQGSGGEYRVGSHELGSGGVAYTLAYDAGTEAKILHTGARGPSLLAPFTLPDNSVAATVAWPAGDKYGFRIPRVAVPTRMRYGLFQVGAQAGNIQVCVMQLSGSGITGWSALLADTGSIACPAVGQQRVDLGAFTLEPGVDYAIGFWASSGSFQTCFQGSVLAGITLRSTLYIGTDTGNRIGASGTHGGFTSLAMNIGLDGDI